MRRTLILTIAALTLAGCNLPDLDVAAYKPRSSGDSTTSQPQQPASKYDSDQPAENTGDYSNYF
jgi:hypothetical protein